MPQFLPCPSRLFLCESIAFHGSLSPCPRAPSARCFDRAWCNRRKVSAQVGDRVVRTVTMTAIRDSKARTRSVVLKPRAQQLREWGTRFHTLSPDGNGFWYGNVWSGPLDPAYDTSGCYPGKLCANRAEAHMYCVINLQGHAAHSPYQYRACLCSSGLPQRRTIHTLHPIGAIILF